MNTLSNRLRSRLSALSRSMHTPKFGPGPLERALSHKSDSILFDGARRRRKRIVLLTLGCSIATCTMCPFPSESHAGVESRHLIQQFESSLEGDRLENYEMLTLFCNGNFFSPQEIDPSVRQYIFTRAREAGLGYVVVESLPQFLAVPVLKSARNQLGSTRLAVFMGLQSADDFVRNACVNTTCSRRAFENACQGLLQQGDIPAAFLMIKPPFLTEQESIQDVLHSLEVLGRLKVRHATLCPARVAPNTILAKLHALGDYQPASVWSLIDILLAYAESGPTQPVVNTTEMKAELNPDSLCFQACSTCKTGLIEAVEEFLFCRDLAILRGLDCPCRLAYQSRREEEQARWKQLSWAQRVERFLEHHGEP